MENIVYQLIKDKDTIKAIENSLDIVNEQMTNPDVYSVRTHEALSRASALASFISLKAAEQKLMEQKSIAAYLESVVKSLNFIIADLKYKIKANTQI